MKVKIDDISNALDSMCDREKAYFYKVVKKLIKDVESYINQLPCVTFNGSSYDINLVKKHLITRLGLDSNDDMGGYVIKKNTKFLCISTNQLKFLDISLYLSPGVSYDKFLKAYGIQMTKGFFPYEWFNSVDKLKEDKLPDYDCFYSRLKSCNVLEVEYNEYLANNDILNATLSPPTGLENYKQLQLLWIEEKMQTFSDYLRHYNNRDVQPFVQAVQKMLALYASKGIDMFINSISVPGIAKKLLFKSCPDNVKFGRFSKKNADLHELIRENIVGGPSIIFHRYHECDETYIREQKDKPCKRVVGHDANALYVYCLSELMPTGSPVVRRRINGFRRDVYSDNKAATSNAANSWLRHIEESQGIKLQTGYNGPEYRVGMYLVDGYCSDTRTIYEFDGCYYHGCLCLKKQNATAIKRRKRTQEKLSTLQNLGYNVVTMTECKWKKQQQYQASSSMSEQEVLESILANNMFGMVKCNVEVPPEKYNYFSEMCPIFKTCDVTKDDIGTHMAEMEETTTKKRRLLIGGMHAQGILLATPLLKFYLKHGMIISNIELIIEYQPEKCFQKFTDEVTMSRRAADSNPETKILADTNKLIGNSAYGVVLMRNDRHRRIKYINDSSRLSAEFNKFSFTRCEKIDDKLYELQHAKTRISHDLPLHLGFFILQYAKLRLLEYYYDFLDYYGDRRDFQFICCDTDSAYIALSTNTLRESVRNNLLLEFDSSVSQHCGRRDYKPTLNNSRPFLQRNCCENDMSYDARTPGLFKVECSGQGIIALSSKTYCVKTLTSPKVSCKGVNKSSLDRNTVYTMYKNVLFTKMSQYALNRGIRLLNNTMITYEQKRCGFRYSYWKRKLSEDGVSTTPLEICL